MNKNHKGGTQFEWLVGKALLKNVGIDRDALQIRNHYNDMLKKLKAWEWIIRGIGVGVDSNTRAVKLTNETWARSLQVHYVIILKFRK